MTARAREVAIALGLVVALLVATSCARQAERIVLGTVITVVGVGTVAASTEEGEAVDSGAASSAGYLMVIAGLVLVVSGIYDGPAQPPAAAMPIPPIVGR